MKSVILKTSNQTKRSSDPLAPGSLDLKFISSVHDKSPLFFSPVTIQPKLEIGSPDDEYEQEADQVADKVMRMPESRELKVQRKCKECEEEEKKKVQKKADQGSNQVPTDLVSQLNNSSKQGSFLDDETNKEMSSKFGRDFSNVRVHADKQSTKMSLELGAKAFTYGKDIYFKRSLYNPKSFSGKKLLAHELTHVVQQNSNHKPNRVLQRDIEGTFRVQWRNKIDSEIKDRGNEYAVAVVAGISAASMPSRYDDTVKTFLEELQTEVGKYALEKVLDNVPGGGLINAFVGAMTNAKKNIEAHNIEEAYNEFKRKTRDVLLAGIDRMTDSQGQFNRRLQDIIINQADHDSRFNEPPSATEDADRYSQQMQIYIQRQVNLHMFGNADSNFSHLIAQVNDFIQRSFQYFVLARAEVLAEYHTCMAREATEGSACDQGFWSWERYPSDCRREHCNQWLTYAPMPPNWTGPQPHQENIGMCGGQECTWFTISTGVEQPAGHADVRESEYRRQMQRYRR